MLAHRQYRTAAGGTGNSKRDYGTARHFLAQAAPEWLKITISPTPTRNSCRSLMELYRCVRGSETKPDKAPVKSVIHPMPEDSVFGIQITSSAQ